MLFASTILGTMGFSIGYYWALQLVPALAIGALAALLPLLVLRFKRDRRLKGFNQKLPDALDLIARALRDGHSIVNAAIEMVAEEAPEPLRSEFGEVYKQQNFGIPNRDALLQLGRRVPSTDLQVVITAILVQEGDRRQPSGNSGADYSGTARPAAYSGGAACTHRARAADRLDSFLLPLVMFCLISLTNPGYSAMLVHDPAGQRLAYAGICMMAMGGLLIRKIVRIKSELRALCSASA